MVLMDIDLKKNSLGVFGSHRCGKSHFLKKVGQNYDTVVFDVLREYDSQKYDVYRPQNSTQDHLEESVNNLIGDIRDTKKAGKASWELFIMSEVSSYISNNHYGGNVNQFLNYYRHDLDNQGWDMGFAYDARRPAKVSADMREITKYFAIFGGIKGQNDIKALNNMNQGLGEAVKNLDTPFDQEKGPNHTPYEFILVHPDRSFQRMPPI